MRTIAILGATSHIARGLIFNFLNELNNKIYLFARSKEKVKSFLRTINYKGNDVEINSFNKFNYNNYDVIINCVGIGSPQKLKASGGEIFFLTEEFDNLILKYLHNKPETVYINFSSGAVYGSSFEKPVNEGSVSEILINHITDTEYYRIAKINSEAKHRSLNKYKIIDLRVFSYFSRFIDLTEKYLICDIINCIINHKIFETNPADIIRDYIHPYDLFQIVMRCIQFGFINASFDIYSLKEITKFEVIDFFIINYNLIYVVDEEKMNNSVTGDKKFYFSINRSAEKIGYKPVYSSLDSIKSEVRSIL